MNNLNHNEKRRFFRQRYQSRLHFIQAHEDIHDAKRAYIDFFSDDVQYLSNCFEHFVANKKADFEHEVRYLLSGKGDYRSIEQALIQISKKISLLEKALNKISNGQSPKKDRVLMAMYRKMSQPINLEGVQNNQKTQKLIQLLDHKVLYFLGVVERVADRSTFDEIYSEDFVKDFEIEPYIASLRKAYATNHSKLAKLFITLYEHLDEIIRVFNDVINGRTFVTKPHLWPVRNLNLSAGGIGFTTSYKLEVGMVLDVFVALDGVTDRDGKPPKIRQKGKVMHIIDRNDHYCVGVHFINITASMIDLINSYVFKIGVSESLKYLDELNRNETHYSDDSSLEMPND